MKELFLLKEQKMKLYPHITRLVFLVIVLLSLGESCKEKKTYCEENPSECSNIQGVKDYFCFKQGSWWVYEEQTSLERDSVYVTESYNNTSNYDFDVRLYSTYQDYFYHFYPFYVSANGCSQSGNTYNKCVIVNRSKYKPGESVGVANCFFFKFKIGQSETTFNNEFPNNKIIVEDILSSYTIGTITFSNSVKIHELNTFVEGKQPTNHYFTPGIGLIRKELIDSNQVWNLVSYHIEP